ncbi:MAG: ABC transporter ATP-binding protein [Rhodothermales bacterium]|nr:ABC transporter ATP-binding protein [Rhodothermales bacterium]MBO6780138.1 ABC transporter ATP-binding protein [Rhodothermales bacterium]
MKQVELSATGLAKRFGARIVFRDISLSVAGGQALAITGHNGSGKSTLVRILAGVLRPTRGEVTLSVGGASVNPSDRPFRCGLAAPYVNLYDHFSAAENLRFIARARELEGAEERIARGLEMVGLAGREDDLLRSYSSGMRQRARLAAAVLHDPEVLLLDEPGSNLDDAGRGVVRRLIRESLDAGRVVLVATNDAAEADLCGSRVTVG